MAQILSKKKEGIWLSPTWLRYQEKKQREPGPNRYQATKIEVSLLTEKQAKIKTHSNSNQTFVEQSIYEQYSAPLPRKEKLYRFWLFITRGHSLRNKTLHVSFAIKVVFLDSNIWSKYVKSHPNTTYTFLIFSYHTADLA